MILLKDFYKDFCVFRKEVSEIIVNHKEVFNDNDDDIVHNVLTKYPNAYVTNIDVVNKISHFESEIRINPTFKLYVYVKKEA